MFVFMGFVHQQCVDAHLVEILDVVHIAVEHFFRFGLGVVLGFCLALFILGCLFVSRFIGNVRKFRLGFLNLAFRLFHEHAFRIFGFHLLQHHLLFGNFVLYEFYAAFRAVRDTFEYRLRHNNHIPVVILDFRVEIPAAFSVAVCVFKGQNLCVGVQCFRALHKLADRGVLHHDHRFTCCTEPPHFHGRCNERIGLARAYFMCEYL